MLRKLACQSAYGVSYVTVKVLSPSAQSTVLMSSYPSVDTGLKVSVWPLWAYQDNHASSQSIGSPSLQNALSAKVDFTVSGASLVFSKDPKSVSGATEPSGAKYQNPRTTRFIGIAFWLA